MLNSVKSLVLNYSYEPLQFCSAKRAIIMVFNERAEFIESDGYVCLLYTSDAADE